VLGVQFGLRALARHRWFSLVAVSVLALGIGSTAAVFTVAHSVLLAPLAYPASDRLVWILNYPTARGVGERGLLGADFLEIRRLSHSFESSACYLEVAWAGTGFGDPVRVLGARVSKGFFETLGVRPIAGRTFAPESYHRDRNTEVLLGYEFWQRTFGGDRSVIGRRVTLDDAPYEVVGILPSDFALANYDLWAPMAEEWPYLTGRSLRTMRAFARLKPGVSMQQAQAEASFLSADLSARFADDRQWALHLVSFLDQAVGGIRQTIWTFSVAVVCLLLISCSNVASLLAARGAARVREMAVRTALGASRGRLILQLLAETAPLAILGGAFGLALAAVSVRWLASGAADSIPRANQIHVDLWVAAFTFLVCLLAAGASAIGPALAVSHVNVQEALRDGGRGSTGGRARNRFRSALVVAEVALGVALMVAAGLLVRTFRELSNVRPGWDASHVLTFQITLSQDRYADRNLTLSFFERMMNGLEQLPGVESAGSTHWIVLRPGPERNSTTVGLEGDPAQTGDSGIVTDNRVITPDYLRAIRVPLVAGRFFDWHDRVGSPPVILVNDIFAREFFPKGDAVGKRIYWTDFTPSRMMQIVGIVGSFREADLSEVPKREVFTPYAQNPIRNQTIVVRTFGDPAELVPEIRRVVGEIDQEVPIYSARALQDRVDQSLAVPRLRGSLLTLFSVAALLLAALGLYGIIACNVAERRQELGIRMALGARSAQVRGMLISQGLSLTLTGLAVGLAGAAALTRLLRGMLYGVSAWDPVTFVVVPAMFILATLIASYVPAKRALKIDPVEALRAE